MRLWRRKRLVRRSAIGLVAVAAILAWLLLGEREGGYVPGEKTAGIVDTLGRSVPSDHPRITFSEVAEEAGLHFEHFAATRTNQLPEDMGSGVALGDADGDGWTDVFLANLAGTLPGAEEGWRDSASSCRLFRNLGNGHFQDVTESSRLGLRALAHGAAWVDADSDGDLDLFVSTYGRCHLFRNEGDCTFVDVSRAAGVDVLEGFWTGVAIGDYDADGAVDIYVCGYVKYRKDLGPGASAMRLYGASIPAPLNPSVFEPERNLLFHNRGDGTFEEVAAEAGVLDERGRGLGATFADLSGDGLPDLYVANDVSDNALYVNRGDGTFEDRTSSALLGDYRGAMGMALADVDGDLDLDLYVTHWVAQENALYMNVSRDLASEAGDETLVFLDEADKHGLGQIALDLVGWATGFIDYDNDGWCDLFVVNGSTIPSDQDDTVLVPMRPQLFWNAGPERGFFEVGATASAFFTKEIVGRGGAQFDYDLDGDRDILVLAHGGSVFLLRNDGGESGGSLLLRLRQTEGNRFALGASVVVKWGDRAMLCQLGAQGSYLSQHTVGELAFGLGSAPQMDSIEVLWPDGTRERAGPFPAGSVVTWVKGAAPEISGFPGSGTSSARIEPSTIEDQRRFYRLLRDAATARIAGDSGKAEAAYREALELWPGHEDCLYYLGNLLLDQGRENEALPVFRRLVQQYPKSNRGWMQIGKIRLPGGDETLDDLSEARAAFTRCHEINGEESGPLVHLGLVALLEGHLDLADQYFADAGVLNHRSVAAPYYRGWIAYARGLEGEALEHLRAAHDRAGRSGAGGSVSNEGDTEQQGAMVAAVAESPEDSPVHRWRTLTSRAIDVDLEYGPMSLPQPGGSADEARSPAGAR